MALIRVKGIPMTKEQLEQIYHTARELQMWEHELEHLKSRSPVSSPMPRNGTGKSISDPTARAAESVVDLEKKVREFEEKLQRERDEAVQFILTIPNSLTRMVVYYRCVSLMSWRRVAYEVGGNNSKDGVRMIYKRFIEDL